LDPAVDRLCPPWRSRSLTQFSWRRRPCLVSQSAMHPMAPRSPRHAALLVLAHNGALRPHALPGTPITAPSGAFNCRIQ
ncbi:unnamed protein product, partial [Phaeothamnion confervicola]